MVLRLLCCLAVGVSLSPKIFALGERVFESGADQATLLELYTSEGCSSCPPAETWLSALRESPRLWKEIVPVSYHVAYWDSLGWKDPFSSKVFTQRQYTQAAAWGTRQVYTPCFVRNGAEWRPNEKGARPRAEVGVLAVTWEEQHARIRFSPTVASGEWEAWVAVLGNGYETAVKAGENAGRTLRHDFVALKLAPVALQKTGSAEYTGEIELEPGKSNTPLRKALAAWVVRRGDFSPVQAVGGWLD